MRTLTHSHISCILWFFFFCGISIKRTIFFPLKKTELSILRVSCRWLHEIPFIQVARLHSLRFFFHHWNAEAVWKCPFIVIIYFGCHFYLHLFIFLNFSSILAIQSDVLKNHYNGINSDRNSITTLRTWIKRILTFRVTHLRIDNNLRKILTSGIFWAART